MSDYSEPPYAEYPGTDTGDEFNAVWDEYNETGSDLPFEEWLEEQLSAAKAYEAVEERAISKFPKGGQDILNATKSNRSKQLAEVIGQLKY